MDFLLIGVKIQLFIDQEIFIRKDTLLDKHTTKNTFNDQELQILVGQLSLL